MIYDNIIAMVVYCEVIRLLSEYSMHLLPSKISIITKGIQHNQARQQWVEELNPFLNINFCSVLMRKVTFDDLFKLQ